MATMEERVQRGVALLNEQFPSWKRVVDPNTLAMNLPEACIMGQLFGGYGPGLHRMGIDHQVASDYGFDVEIADNVVESYADLNHEWLLELAS